MKKLLFGKYIFRVFLCLLFLICHICMCNNLWGLSLEGKVLTVNLQENFLILDVGEKNNVFKGKKFNVFKDNKLIGITEVLQTKKDVAAFDTELLKKSVFLIPKDVLVLKEIDEDSSEITKLPGITVKSGGSEKIVVSKKDRKNIEDATNKRDKVYERKKAPLLVRPFKKVKDWTVGAGREVKSWFEDEEQSQYKSKSSEFSETMGTGILDVADVSSGVKLEINMVGGRRKILFMINEELKNRGFVVTNYSVIEGTIHAQKFLELSIYDEIFANIKSAIDHKVIYFITVKKIDKNSSHISVNISAAYRKADEYNEIEIQRNSNLVYEAKEILTEVKNKI